MKDHETVETVPEIEPLCANVLETPSEDSENVQNGRARLWLVVLCASFAFIVSGSLISPSRATVTHWTPLEAASLGAAVSEWCNSAAEIPVGGERKFNLTGAWKEKCASLPHPAASEAQDEARRNWCWEYMKHNGCYATHGFSSWKEDQWKLSGEGRAPPPIEARLSLEGLRHPSLCEVPGFGRAWKTVDEAVVRKLKSMVSVYVLSMSEERWQIISQRLHELHFPDVQRIQGVDLTKPGALDDAVQQGLLPSGLQLRHHEGTFGCAAGHLRVMKTAEHGESRAPFALVFEDDIHPHEDFFAKLASLLEEVPCDWEVISLKSRCPFGSCVSQHLSRVMVDGNGASCSGLNFGFFGMLYKVDALPKVRHALGGALATCHDVDVALATVSDRVAYYAVPAIQQPGLVHELHLPSIRDAKNA